MPVVGALVSRCSSSRRCAGAYVFYRAMPAYSGAETLPGLSAETRVWRDAYGVPHIFAASMDDAARALGYLHASERLFQMEIQRRVGQGRIAEIQRPGPSQGRSLHPHARLLPRGRNAASRALSPGRRSACRPMPTASTPFSTATQDALPPEFLLLGDKPEPWKPADSLVWGKLLSLQLCNNYKFEALRAQFAQKIAAGQAGWLFPGLKPDAPITTAPASSNRTRARRARPDTIGDLIGMARGASNEWVVAGSRTVTGKPILANDPHLELGAPILWYLARIVTPEGSVKGATVPGEPVVLLGQNDNIAWGFTTADTDAQDLFVETVDPADPGEISDAGRPEGVRYARRDDPRQGRAPTSSCTCARRGTGRCSPTSARISRASPSPARSIALAFTGLGDQRHDRRRR